MTPRYAVALFAVIGFVHGASVVHLNSSTGVIQTGTPDAPSSLFLNATFVGTSADGLSWRRVSSDDGRDERERLRRGDVTLFLPTEHVVNLPGHVCSPLIFPVVMKHDVAGFGVTLLTTASRCDSASFHPTPIVECDVVNGCVVDASSSALSLLATDVGLTQTVGWLSWSLSDGTTSVMRLAYQSLEHIGATCGVVTHNGSDWESVGDVSCLGVAGGTVTSLGDEAWLFTTAYTVSSGSNGATSTLWRSSPEGHLPVAVDTLQTPFLVDAALVMVTSGEGVLATCSDTLGDTGGVTVYHIAPGGFIVTPGALLPGTAPCASVVMYTTMAETMTAEGVVETGVDATWIVSSRTSAPEGSPDVFVFKRPTTQPSFILETRIPFNATTTSGLSVDTWGVSHAVVTGCASRSGVSGDVNTSPSRGCVAWTHTSRGFTQLRPDVFHGATHVAPFRDATSQLPAFAAVSSGTPEALDTTTPTTIHVVTQ